MASCFDTLVGLSNRTCDCYEEGRPAGGAGESTRQEWKYQTFETGASPANPLIISTVHALPETFSDETIQVFEGGVRINVDDLDRESDTELSIAAPAPNTTLQVWFLAETDSAAFTPAYNQSTSGLFLSDLLPEEEIQGLVNCDNTVWDVYTDARRIAIKEFAQSLNSHIQPRYQIARKAFSGYLGESTNDGTLSTDKTYAGLRIRTNPVKSGYLRISRIMAMFSATGTVPITIYDGDGTVITPTFSINTQAGRKAVTDVGITLPLLRDFNSVQDYFVTFEVDPANLPKLNKVYCSTCNGQKNITNVTHYTQGQEWASHYQKTLGWQNWLIVGGWEADGVSDFTDAPDNLGVYANGLVLEIEVGCDLTDGLCRLVEGTGPEAQAAATFIQRRSAAIAVGKRLASSTPNRANLVNKEEMRSRVAEWEADAAEAMAYLAQNVNESMNDCVVCAPRMRLGAVMS